MPGRNFLQQWPPVFATDRSSNSLLPHPWIFRSISTREIPVKVRWFNGVMNCLSRCKNTTSSFPIKPTIDFLRSFLEVWFFLRFETNCKLPIVIPRQEPSCSIREWSFTVRHILYRKYRLTLFSFFFFFTPERGVTLFSRSNDVFACGEGSTARSFTVADVWWEYPTKCQRASLTRFRCATR